MNETGWYAAIAAAVAWVIRETVPHILTLKKANAEAIQAEQDGITEQWRKLVGELHANMTKVQEEMKLLQREHLLCREENAGLKVQIAELRSDIAELRAVQK